MRKMVVISLIICFSFSIFLGYKQAINNEIEDLATLETRVGTPFILPENELLMEGEEIYPALMRVAKEKKLIYLDQEDIIILMNILKS